MRRFRFYFAMILFLASSSQANNEWWILGGTTALITGAAAGIWFGIQPASSCQWCEPSKVDLDITESLRWSNPDTANLVSNIVGYGLVPAGSLATVVGYSAPEWKRFAYYGLILVDAGLLELFVSEWMKKGIARQRPESFYNHTRTNKESYVSFPSGHTSLVFALTSITTAISHREQGRFMPHIAITGSLLSGFTGYLRIAALKHWISDVAAGAAIGIMTGLIPTVLFRALPET